MYLHTALAELRRLEQLAREAVEKQKREELKRLEKLAAEKVLETKNY